MFIRPSVPVPDGRQYIGLVDHLLYSRPSGTGTKCPSTNCPFDQLPPHPHYMLHTTRCAIQVTYYKLHVTYYTLQVTVNLQVSSYSRKISCTICHEDHNFDLWFLSQNKNRFLLNSFFQIKQKSISELGANLIKNITSNNLRMFVIS
jgi:hypothetical protein